MQTGEKGRATVLLADDSDDDRLLLSYALQKAGIPRESLSTVKDGEEAISRLCDHPRPDLLILDLKMPKLDGFDVLGWIKTKPELANLPVVVVSASDFDHDRELACDLGARDFFQKVATMGPMVAQFTSWKTRFLVPEGNAS